MGDKPGSRSYGYSLDSNPLSLRLIAIATLLHVTTPSGELADQKLLGQACANPLSRADCKIAEDQPGTTIGLRIIKVRESR